MANFTAKDVQKLRQMTGVGMMDSKKALTKADGDMDKAVAILREEGLAAATKKADRIAAEGIVLTLVEDGVGVVVEVNAETDFVAKNKDFVAFVESVAKTIIKENPTDVEALKELTMVDSDMTVVEALNDRIHVIGENMNIRRFQRYEGVVFTYTHGDGRIGVMVELDTDIAPDTPELETVAMDVAMQIAAMSPKYVSRDEVPADEVAAEKEILKAQALNEGKPEHIVEKMVEGRIGKFFETICLLEQPFVKDGDITVEQYLANSAKEIGGSLAVSKFVRFEKGEGLERREENFADEVASMMK